MSNIQQKPGTGYIYKKINKYLIHNLGEEDTLFIWKKFGNSESFLNTICLLPYWFSESFYTNDNRQNIVLFSEANLKSWIGYTLYDYIRDGKIPKNKINKFFSISNILIHDALKVFIEQTSLDQKRVDMLELYNKIDLFYIKESDNLIPHDFKKICGVIYEKSIAAAICALLVTPNNLYINNRKNIINFFKYYFTARQLSDDLDDYKKDLKSKIFTPMTLLINKKIDEKDATLMIRKQIDFNFNKAIKSIKKIEKFDHENFINKYMKPC